MAVSGLARLAISAPAAIYPVVGKDGLAAVEDLSLHPAVSLQPTPRHASVLLVSGEIRRGDHPALRRLHDQLPHPRATLWWLTTPAPGFPQAEIVQGDVANAVDLVWQQPINVERRSEVDRLPHSPPAAGWGKAGPGQGAESEQTRT